MIKLIYGPKGSGKTKKIIDSANAALDVCDGNVVFITDTLAYSKEVKTDIRFVNVKDYGDSYSCDALLGFIRGVIASNSDIKRMYVDGVARITALPASELEELLIDIEALSDKSGFDIYLALSCDKLPSYAKKYV